MDIPSRFLLHAKRMAQATGNEYIVATVDDDTEANGRRFIVAKSDYAKTDEFEAFFGAVELTFNPGGTYQ